MFSRDAPHLEETTQQQQQQQHWIEHLIDLSLCINRIVQLSLILQLFLSVRTNPHQGLLPEHIIIRLKLTIFKSTSACYSRRN